MPPVGPSPEPSSSDSVCQEYSDRNGTDSQSRFLESRYASDLSERMRFPEAR